MAHYHENSQGNISLMKKKYQELMDSPKSIQGNHIHGLSIFSVKRTSCFYWVFGCFFLGISLINQVQGQTHLDQLRQDWNASHQMWQQPRLQMRITFTNQHIDTQAQEKEVLELYIAENEFCYVFPQQNLEIQGNAKYQMVIQHEDLTVFIAPTQGKNPLSSLPSPDSLIKEMTQVQLTTSSIQSVTQRTYKAHFQKQSGLEKGNFHFQIQSDGKPLIKSITFWYTHPEHGRIQAITTFESITFPNSFLPSRFDALRNIKQLDDRFVGLKKYKNYEIISAN